MKAQLEGKVKSPPGANPDYDAFVTSQAGIGEKDLALAIECGRAAAMNMDVPEEARKHVRSIMTEALVYKS
jgi:hypothetical protein